MQTPGFADIPDDDVEFIDVNFKFMKKTKRMLHLDQDTILLINHIINLLHQQLP